MSKSEEIRTTQWDGYLREGPGAATAALPVIEVDDHAGHQLEPEYKRVPIDTGHPLYPILVSLASFPMLMGAAGHHLADDMPDDETHPFFPDHFWPYPVIMTAMLIAVGLLSAFVQQNMALEQSADPRTVVVPRPDWYFLFLFQFLKLGPELIMSLVVPPLVIGILLVWPFIDSIGGTKMARALNWATWPVPGRNIITGTIWILALGFIVMLEFWALSGVTIFGITGG
jgi:hypothetical protein